MRIRYLSEAAALALMPAKSIALVSITEPGREAPLIFPAQWGALLRVQFADAEYDEAMIQRLQARGRTFDAEAKGFPSRATSEALRAFLDALQARRDIAELIVHCHAGQRRSAAVAKFASERFSANFDREYDGYNKTVYALLVDPCRYEKAGTRARRGPLNSLVDWLFAKHLQK